MVTVSLWYVGSFLHPWTRFHPYALGLNQLGRHCLRNHHPEQHDRGQVGAPFPTFSRMCLSHLLMIIGSYSDQALRIKTDASASGSTVTNITYSGNTGTGLRQFGVLIDQVYVP